MSQQYSNASTGDAPADPYKAANKDDTSLEQKVKDFVDFAQECKFGMMTTRDASTGNLVSRAMGIAATETDGIDLLFHTNTESHKTDEIVNDPHVNMSFVDVQGDWASVSGVSSIVTDRDLIKKHYNPTLKAWVGDLGDGTHDGSENDPRIGIIRVKAKTITYSLSSRGIFGKVSQIVQGAVTGSPAQVNKLREISDEEVKQWRAMHPASDVPA